jgi:hypothetical protein
MESKEWIFKPDEPPLIPKEYLTGLKYEILVLSSKKIFQFKCRDYALNGQVCVFNHVIMDTSERNARGQIQLQRISYHETIVLGNTGFMAIPIPETEITSP